MGFLNSLGLWSGLAAAGVAVPILIHLLYRKNRRETRWAAMELLRRALVVRSGQVKLEDYLVLSLRCLALLLVAAALLRPTLNSNTKGWLGESQVGMVVAIDASYSMGHGEHSRLEKAIERAREVLATAREGDPVSIVLMSHRTQIPLRRVGYSKPVFDAALDELKKPSPHGLNLDRNLEKLLELVEELRTSSRECYVITDLQETDWTTLSEPGLASLQRLSSAAEVYVVPVVVDDESNISLTRLGYASGSLRASGVARFIAEVQNQGRSATDGDRVEFFVGDELVSRSAVGALEAGESRALSFFASFTAPGDVRLRARIAGDELAADNERFAIAPIAEAIRVLCVQGSVVDERASDRSGAYYAVRALRLRERDAGSPLRVEQIHADDLGLETLADHDVVLLANVADLAPEMVSRLDRFVQKGGGLVVFLGDRVDASLYNERFGSGASGLLPARLVETISSSSGEDESVASSWTFAPVKSTHRLATIVARLPEALVDALRIETIFRVEPASGSETILSVTKDDAPLLLARQLGAGSVLLFTTSADRSWGELPVHPAYAMLLQQAVTSLTSRPETREILVGEPVAIPLDGRRVGDVVRVTGPDAESSEIRVTVSGERSILALDPERTGVYEIAGDESLTAIALAANVDPAESNVRVLDTGAVRTRLESVDVELVEKSSELAPIIEDRRQGRELSTILLALGIFIFLLQSVLARAFTQRMSQGDADVAASLQMSQVAAARRS